MRLVRSRSPSRIAFDPSGVDLEKMASRRQKRALSGQIEVTHQSISKERARMAIIVQMKFFSWEAVQPLGNLERLQLVVDRIPDEPLMRILERARGRGRNDYPVRVL
jgi:hypothetical protein